MSMTTLENEIVRCLKRKLGNQKITKAWIQEWCTTVITAEPGEELVEITEPGMHMFVSIKNPKAKK